MTDPTSQESLTVVKTQAERMAPRTLTVAELRAEATARFGDDPYAWRFECPHCGDIATIYDFRAALEAHPRLHLDGEAVASVDLAGQECIGRTLAGGDGSSVPPRGCNWAAYGVFPGPWTVQLTDGRIMRAFPLADEA